MLRRGFTIFGDILVVVLLVVTWFLCGYFSLELFWGIVLLGCVAACLFFWRRMPKSGREQDVDPAFARLERLFDGQYAPLIIYLRLFSYERGYKRALARHGRSAHAAQALCFFLWGQCKLDHLAAARSRGDELIELLPHAPVALVARAAGIVAILDPKGEHGLFDSAWSALESKPAALSRLVVVYAQAVSSQSMPRSRSILQRYLDSTTSAVGGGPFRSSEITVSKAQSDALVLLASFHARARHTFLGACSRPSRDDSHLRFEPLDEALVDPALYVQRAANLAPTLFAADN
jgi:hypothetical protein